MMMTSPMASGLPSHLQSRPGQKVTQYRLAQNDLGKTGDLACTTIACLASAGYLRAGGSVKKFIKTKERASEIIRDGVQWHTHWLALNDTRKPESSMACVDEVCNELPQLGVAVSDRWYAGGLGKDGFGVSLPKAVQLIFAEAGLNLSKGMKIPQAYILTTRGYSTMLGVCGRSAIVFDSHQRKATSGLAVAEGETGAAVLVEFGGPRALTSYLNCLYGSEKFSDELYVLQEVMLRFDSETLSSGSEAESVDTVPEACDGKTSNKNEKISVMRIISEPSTSSIGKAFARPGKLLKTWSKERLGSIIMPITSAREVNATAAS
eukprot:comp21634_c0_seq1/m.30391 comp21634_c0_seq1/g.30391  ORF comp21634_c0_seq1/g.30391 comp21634_c0_seq1/m.30391 type:complete len:321 (-) comp21634_c0_seq1:804-1766(-)